MWGRAILAVLVIILVAWVLLTPPSAGSAPRQDNSDCVAHDACDPEHFYDEWGSAVP